jgi:Flp pilus assembly protein TadB
LEIISVFTTALWVVELIMGNITVVLFAILGMMVIVPVVYVQRENLKEMFPGRYGTCK